MSWIDDLDNNHFLKTLYPSAAPVLNAVRLHEVRLHQDGPAVWLRFDLNGYPSHAPAKWQAARSNTVQLGLVGSGVQKFALRGWACNNIGRLVVNGATNGIIAEFDSGECRMTAVFDHLRIDSVTAYYDEQSRGSP